MRSFDESDWVVLAVSFDRYDTNVLGTKGPRKMTVIVPPVTDDGHVMATTEEGMLERVKGGEFGDCQKLHNKAPRWNESLGAYCLNFNGRVTLPSVKNFQLQLEGASDPNQVSLQFGKTGDSTFTMDYSFPLSPLQAFQVRHAWGMQLSQRRTDCTLCCYYLCSRHDRLACACIHRCWFP